LEISRIFESKHKMKKDDELPRPRRRLKPVVFWILFIVVSVGAYFAYEIAYPPKTSYRPAAPARETNSSITQEDEKGLQMMLDAKMLDRINPQMNEAFINPVEWAKLKYDEKKQVGWFLARYCGRKKGTGLCWVEIKDSYSGRKLAKYSESWGFTVY
jgi:hypothetical protein